MKFSLFKLSSVLEGLSFVNSGNIQARVNVDPVCLLGLNVIQNLVRSSCGAICKIFSYPDFFAMPGLLSAGWVDGEFTSK